jgi:hypothetical protein
VRCANATKRRWKCQSKRLGRIYIRTDSFSRTPETVRAWSTIISALALISLIVWVPLSLSLLGRFGRPLPNLASVGSPSTSKSSHRTGTCRVRKPYHWHILQISGTAWPRKEMKTASVEGVPIVRSLPNFESRLGALYSLERLLRESEKDQRAILETRVPSERPPTTLNLQVQALAKTVRLQRRRSNWSRQGREEWALPTALFKLRPPGQNLTVSSMSWMAQAPTLGSA